MGRVLVISSNKNETKRISKIFEAVSIQVEVSGTVDAALERIPQDPPSLVLAINPGQVETLKNICRTVYHASPVTPVLVAVDGPSAEEAVEWMQAGAYDCISRPYTSYDLLAAAKRASQFYGRLLFANKLRKKKKYRIRWVLGVVFTVLLIVNSIQLRNGPPAPVLTLGSATLSGIQWENESLWVADWYESTVSRFEVLKSFFPSRRQLIQRDLYKLPDIQPIFIANSKEHLVSIGTDLKLRIHQRSVGLPSYASVKLPGTHPSGIVWDGKNIWTADEETGFLYRHNDDLTVLSSIKSILPRVSGLAWDGEGIWVVGENTSRLARLKPEGSGYIWEGPYTFNHFLPEGVKPSGLAAGFNRLWSVGGGDPKMYSISMPDKDNLMVLQAEKKGIKNEP